VENALHWVLDVTFREDDSRVRDRTAARNLALLRKIALNLVAKDRGSRASLRGRRKKAAWNDDYMLQLIVGRARKKTGRRSRPGFIPSGSDALRWATHA
jgi:hypothetical protein